MKYCVMEVKFKFLLMQILEEKNAGLKLKTSEEG